MNQKPHADFETAKLLKEMAYKGPSEYFFFPWDAKIPPHTKPEREDQYLVYHRTKDIGGRKAGFELGKEYKEGTLHLTLPAPLWWELKLWLWEEFKINLQVKETRSVSVGRKFDADMKEEYDKSHIAAAVSDNPIDTEVEAIKQAVKYVHENHKQLTSLKKLQAK